MNHLIFQNAKGILGLSGMILGFLMYLVNSLIVHGYIAMSQGALWIIFGIILTIMGFVICSILSLFHYWAYRDFLTGVWNRKYFSYKLKEEIKIKRKTGMEFCVALIDMDNFKQVNDTYGHSYGDEVIKQVAKVLKRNVRKGDEVIRLGGDEFAIIFPKTSEDKANIISERIRAVVERKCSHVTVSIGILAINNDVDANCVFNFVDDMLYSAKETKNSIRSMAI